MRTFISLGKCVRISRVMKRFVDGRVPLHEDIERMLADGRHMDLLRSGPPIVRHVDFAHAIVRESFNTCPYEIMWDTGIPKRANQVVCLFPNHENRTSERHHVLRASGYWWLSSFNKELNRRFKASLNHTESAGSVRFAVCYGRHVYVCDGIQGHIYILWARYVNRTNHGNRPNTLFTDVPCIVNTDGCHVVTGLYILRERIEEDADLIRVPIEQHSPSFIMPKNANLFVCEVRVDVQNEGAANAVTSNDPVSLNDKGYTLLTQKQALARITAPTPALQRQEQGQLDPDGVSADFEHMGQVDLGIIQTPRGVNGTKK